MPNPKNTFSKLCLVLFHIISCQGHLCYLGHTNKNGSFGKIGHTSEIIIILIMMIIMKIIIIIIILIKSIQNHMKSHENQIKSYKNNIKTFDITSGPNMQFYG